MISNNMRPILKNTWNSGFFSCCTDKLRNICKYHSENPILPIIDSTEQWELYKDEGIDNIQQWWGGTVKHVTPIDITEKFFEKKTIFDDFVFDKFSEDIVVPTVCNDDQYSIYKKINFDYVNNLTNIYFTPSEEIIYKKNELIKKYELDLENTLSVCYRGNDKFLETNIPTYEEMLIKINEISSQMKNPKILLQSDELDFCEYIQSKISNCFVIEETKKIKKQTTAIQYTLNKGERLKSAQVFLSVMVLMSETNSVILNSGNVGLWLCLFRKNTKNLHQFLCRKNTNDNRTWY